MGFLMDILLALKASDKQIEEIAKQKLEKNAKDQKEYHWGQFRWYREIPMTMMSDTDDDEEEHRWLWWRGSERNGILEEMNWKGGRWWRRRVKTRFADDSMPMNDWWMPCCCATDIFTKNSRYLASFKIDVRDLLLHSFHPVIFSISWKGMS